MSWSIWLVPSSVWVGEVWSKHGLKWLQECAFTCWRPISPLWFLRNSAIGCKWGTLAPFIYLFKYLFIYLFMYIFGSSFLLSVWLIWDMSSQTIPDNLSVTGPWKGLVYGPPFFPYLFVYFFLIFSLIFGFVSPSVKIAQESVKSTIVWCHWKGVVHLLCRSTPVFWNDSIWEGPWVPLTI